MVILVGIYKYLTDIYYLVDTTYTNLLHINYYIRTNVYIIIYISYSYNRVHLKKTFNEQSVANPTTQYDNTHVFDFNIFHHVSF